MPGLAARAGVVTGEVAVTVGATGQGMVAGDAVNTAARVQTAAEPGTRARRRGHLAAGARRGRVHRRGRAGPQGQERAGPLWRAERVMAGVGGAQRVDGLEAPLVGRDAELRLVKELFHACVDRRSPRLVSIIGPAGVGKSRLGWEFFKYIDGLLVDGRGGTVAVACPTATASRSGRWPRWCASGSGIAEDDSTQRRRGEARHGTASNWLDDRPTRDYVAPGWPGCSVSSTRRGRQLGREELFAGWRLFFERIARRYRPGRPARRRPAALPTTVSSTSSSTCSTGPETCRSSS